MVTTRRRDTRVPISSSGAGPSERRYRWTDFQDAIYPFIKEDFEDPNGNIDFERLDAAVREHTTWILPQALLEALTSKTNYEYPSHRPQMIPTVEEEEEEDNLPVNNDNTRDTEVNTDPDVEAIRERDRQLREQIEKEAADRRAFANQQRLYEEAQALGRETARRQKEQEDKLMNDSMTARNAEAQREARAKAQADAQARALSEAREKARQDGASGSGTTQGEANRVHYMLGRQPANVDPLNERDNNGKFKNLDTATIARNSLGYTGGSYDLINDAHVDDRVRKIVKTLARVNGKPFYDAEENAIGSLDEAYWFLIPAGFVLNICPVEDIGMGLRKFDVDVVSCAAIYHLAKRQCPDLSDENKIKWATLRLEMYKAGWFDHQKMVKRVDLPDDFDKDILDDADTIDTIVKSAWRLCGFVPFVLEFCFRSYGVGYNDNSRNDFQMRAERLATAANIEGVFDYLPIEILFGRAFRWIGVRRPRDALSAQKAVENPAIPRIFFIRYRAAPAGQAIITTAYAVIQSLQSANWWEGIRNQAKYDDVTLIACANEILENPCKYHILGFVYGQPLLTAVEERRVETAKAIASQMSPVLQAYCDVIMKQSDLGKQKVLRKPSDGNKALYAKSRELFLYARKHKVTNVAELFVESIFDPVFSTAHIERDSRIAAGTSRKRTRSEMARAAAEELED